MIKEIELSPRLRAIADFVPQGARVIDVGTDHGYIPVFLVQKRLASAIFASDINEGPIARARQNAALYGVEDRISFARADGLSGAESLGVDTVIIAGMGGELIASILENALWVRDRGVRLILQPQSKLCEMSNWLDNNGFAIDDARLAKDAGRIYTVFSVSAGESRAPFSCAEMYADRLLMQKRDPLLPDYLELLINQFSRALEGMDKAREEIGVDVYDHTLFALRGFMKMREETEKW
ncbi:MAG: SAM-dependent methyltransferase [Oscillospiraceae bacterium]|nr:SAM-dependent methyltransferase [Oscillospiraceae bacterium]